MSYKCMLNNDFGHRPGLSRRGHDSLTPHEVIAPPTQGRRGREYRSAANVAFQVYSRRGKPDGKSFMWGTTTTTVPSYVAWDHCPEREI
jgi:hypothetical protein